MNNPGPTHLLSVPQMQALPWIKCRKELRATPPNSRQTPRYREWVRESKTPIYSFTALFTLSDLLSQPPLSLFLSPSLKLSLSHAHSHLNTLIHSAHSQARVRQPHISPCSAPGWEDRALQGAAITQDTSLGLPERSRKIEEDWDVSSEWNGKLTGSSKHRHLVTRSKSNTL